MFSSNTLATKAWEENVTLTLEESQDSSNLELNILIEQAEDSIRDYEIKFYANNIEANFVYYALATEMSHEENISIDISDCFSGLVSGEVRVVAKAMKINREIAASNEVVVTIAEEKLKQVENLRLEGNTIKWDAVEGAAAYQLQLMKQTGKSSYTSIQNTGLERVTDTSVDISSYAGEVTRVSVRALSGDCASYLHSDLVQMNIADMDVLASSGSLKNKDGAKESENSEESGNTVKEDNLEESKEEAAKKEQSADDSQEKKNFLKVLLSNLLIFNLSGCGHQHTWVEATYEVPKTCTECGETEGEALVAEVPTVDEEQIAAEKAAEAESYMETGRSCLYGTQNSGIDLATAYDSFQKALELGNADANYYLGLLNYEYNYPEYDREAAKAYFEACPENPYAQIELGQMYRAGILVEKDMEKARSLFQSVIDQGYAEGYYGLAKIASSEEDYTVAIEYYEKVLEGEESYYLGESANAIGFIYSSGLGVEVNYELAKEWYEKGIEVGSRTAMHNLGSLYLNGLENYELAIEWYEKAAAAGQEVAMNQIGYMYEKGYGVETNYELAKEWYEKSAEAGYATAMLNLGLAYQHGHGVEVNYELAMEWYQKGADKGLAGAMYQVGAFYYYGRGVEVDYVKAKEWLEKAAEKGMVDAIIFIGKLYELGEGVEQSFDKALEYYDRAAEMGNVYAGEEALRIRLMLQY